MFGMLGLVLLSVSHYYMIQKNLAIIVIEKSIISRQQTQLSSFFENNVDPVLVISMKKSGEHTVEICNPSAQKMLDLCVSSTKSVDNFSKTKLDSKIFKLRGVTTKRVENWRANSVSNESQMEESPPVKTLVSIADLVKETGQESQTLAQLILPGSAPNQVKSVQITRTELIYNGQESVLLKIRDISDIREKEKLSAEIKMLSLMASSVSHEMITPMRCIVHLAGGLEKKLEDIIRSDRSIGKDINLIVKSAQLLLNQVKGYLDRDLLTQNMFVPTLEHHSLNSIVEDVCGMLDTEAQVHGFELVMTLLDRDQGVVVDKMRTQ